jgi:hypothetical protein
MITWHWILIAYVFGNLSGATLLFVWASRKLPEE